MSDLVESMARAILEATIRREEKRRRLTLNEYQLDKVHGAQYRRDAEAALTAAADWFDMQPTEPSGDALAFAAARIRECLARPADPAPSPPHLPPHRPG